MSARLLVVGLGNRGSTWARIIAADPRWTLAGVVDTDPARIAAFEAAHGPQTGFADLATALTTVRPDVVILVTPPDGHLAQARTVFASGTPLLCEKPLTLDLADAVAIVRAGEDAGVPLGVGLNFRYLPVSQALRGLIDGQAFGPAGSGSFAYFRNRDWWRPGMNTYPLSMAHPMMLEQTIHHLDLIRFCYGREVRAVSCRTWNPSWSAYADDANVSCLLDLEGDLAVDYHGTWTGGWNALRFHWRTDCADGVVIQRDLFGDLATAGVADASLTPVEIDPCEPFIDDTRALLAAFLDAVASGRPVPCDGRDHLRTLGLCFAAIEADASGRRVDVEAFYRHHGIAA